MIFFGDIYIYIPLRLKKPQQLILSEIQFGHSNFLKSLGGHIVPLPLLRVKG